MSALSPTVAAVSSSSPSVQCHLKRRVACRLLSLTCRRHPRHPHHPLHGLATIEVPVSKLVSKLTQRGPLVIMRNTTGVARVIAAKRMRAVRELYLEIYLDFPILTIILEFL